NTPAAAVPFTWGHRIRRDPLREPVESEEPDVVPRRTVERKVGQDLAHDRAELVAVAGEPGRHDGAVALRMQVDQDVLVGRRLEEAGLEGHGRAGALGEVAFRERPEGRLVGERRISVDRLWCAALAVVVVPAELEAGDAERGEAVEVLPVER